MTAQQHNASPNGRFTPKGMTRTTKDFPVEEPGPTRAGQKCSAESCVGGGCDSAGVGSLESWGQAMQDVEGHRLLGLEERRKRELDEQLTAYARGEVLGIWDQNGVVAKRVPQRIATLEEMRAEIISRRRAAIELERAGRAKRKESNAD